MQYSKNIGTIAQTKTIPQKRDKIATSVIQNVIRDGDFQKTMLKQSFEDQFSLLKVHRSLEGKEIYQMT